MPGLRAGHPSSAPMNELERLLEPLALIMSNGKSDTH